jgi:hypothetical protein
MEVDEILILLQVGYSSKPTSVFTQEHRIMAVTGLDCVYVHRFSSAFIGSSNPIVQYRRYLARLGVGQR